MKNSTILTVLVAFAYLLLIPHGAADEKLVPGKDRIDVSAERDGLFVHNLFQSGMVHLRMLMTRYLIEHLPPGTR